VPAPLGIELTPAVCRIVRLDRALDWRAEPVDTRVRAFAVLALGDPALATTLASLRGARASVVAWGISSEHRPVVVERGPYLQMRADARGKLRPDLASRPGLLVDIAPAPWKVESTRERAVMTATAPEQALEAILRPLRDAGIAVVRVMTPASALVSLARVRGKGSPPNGIELYVAIGDASVFVAAICRGALLAAQEREFSATQEETSDRADPVADLADALVTFVTACRFDPAQILQVCVCGGLPDLRTVSVRLTERLDVEVEPLDSLFGIDAARLPQPEGVFADRGHELRLAWAAAADALPALDLIRVRGHAARRALLARAALAAGAAAGLGVGWLVQDRWVPPGPSLVRPGFRETARPRAAFAGMEPARPASGPTSDSAGGPAPARGMAFPLAAAPPREPPRSAPRPPSALPAPGANAPRPVARQPEGPAPPFEATLGTILHGPDRTLAIVDGRIIEPGDEVNGARVVEITPTAIVLRDERGRLRRLAAGQARR
jgi:hypothetical protein